MDVRETMGMILSILGMAVTVVSFQAKKKNVLLFLQTVGSCFFLVSYIFAQGGIAVYLNVLFIIRNVLFAKIDLAQSKKKYLLSIALCASYVIAYVLFMLFSNITAEEKWWNLLPVVGSLFGTVAVTFSNVNVLRLWKIGDSVSWLVFNVRIGLGALGGIIGEVLNLTSIAVGLARFRVRLKKSDKNSDCLQKDEKVGERQ